MGLDMEQRLLETAAEHHGRQEDSPESAGIDSETLRTLHAIRTQQGGHVPDQQNRARQLARMNNVLLGGKPC